jgi:Glycosyl hydrolases family 43
MQTLRAARRVTSFAVLLWSWIASPAPAAEQRSWSADNGNGTYSNPLFYDEFSDPDMIRVGSDYYLTGTTMHVMPGLPILHSRDLVNWRIIGYAFDRLNLGPDFRLEDGKAIYGQGIWAPSFRYHHRDLLHLRERESFRAAGVPGLRSARTVEAQSRPADAARSLGAVRR